MANGLILNLTKQSKTKLQRIAVQYGLSLADFSQHILESVSAAVPEELLSDYKNAPGVRTQLKTAMREYRAGKVRSRL